MTRLARAAVIAALLALPASARADGRVVVGWTPTEHAVATSATTPDQRALIVWDEGKETLVIETAFTGAGRDFAWIVPLPSVPTIEASTTGLFPTLEAVAAPEVVHDVAPLWIGCVIIGVGAWLISRRSEDHQFVGRPVVLAGCVFVAWLAVGVGEGDAQYHTKSILHLGDGVGSNADEKAAVVVHERRVVGTVETATISSTDPKTLLDWLATNGYAQAPEIAPVVAQYVAEGWVFVAAKIRRNEDSAAPVRIHPLAFTFATEKPVYPMRLTGPGNGECRVELFVAAKDRAKADGFDVEWCGLVANDRNTGANVMDWSDGMYWRRLPGGELGRLLSVDRTVTLLSRTFDEAAMTRDVEVAWDETRAFRRTRFSAHGAAVIAANAAGLAALLAAAFAWSLDVGRRRGERATAKSPWSRWSWAWIAAVVLVGTFLALPRVPVHVLSDRVSAMRFVLPREIDGKPPTMQSSRAWAADQSRGTRNAITGGDVREEDSPGNYVVRTNEGVPFLVWHDAEGRAFAATDDR